MLKKHKIKFPKQDTSELRQDETFFYLQVSGEDRKIRFHDYAEIYRVQGLYEQIFYDCLKCTSPAKVASLLESTVRQTRKSLTELRVLELGAGNGMMGEELRKRGVSCLIGVDIIPEACDAAVRDRPGMYDAFYVEDVTQLTKKKRDDIASWQCDCLVSVGALGFGDLPAEAFMEAFNIIKDKGWIAFNIKETFLDDSDVSGFSKMIRELVFSEFFDLYHLERYRHRLSIGGDPLYYYAIAGRKNADVPTHFLQS